MVWTGHVHNGIKVTQALSLIRHIASESKNRLKLIANWLSYVYGE
jgi:hypothetical protein